MDVADTKLQNLKLKSWNSSITDADFSNRIGILGASSLVGECLLPMLVKINWHVTAYSRKAVAEDKKIHWQRLPQCTTQLEDETTPFWICVAPIWVLPDYFELLEKQRVRRLVVLSSTSRFTKNDSTDMEEQAIARKLTDAEEQLRKWAENRGVEWVILRPTLIYGFGRDKNIAEIARFIRRFGFFPLFGKANGLRQPIHIEDVAGACLSALQAPCAANRAYNISGGETLSYREMIVRIFSALNLRPRIFPVPFWIFRLAITLLRRIPRYRKWSTAMAERMNQDLVFDHSEASRDFGFKPKNFELLTTDLPT
ncbi:MAG: NAD-dependent epimerase/dehydratase family protein [Methylococcaceae bacterium]|nr:NAD-dependent epimerase/dehydratase family protein [Methylococcaceae bacterium]